MLQNCDLTIENLYIVGISWKTAPLNIRELFVFESTLIPERAKDIKETFGISEIMLLSTCNRTEIIAVSQQKPIDYLIQYMANYAKLDVEEAKQYIYTKNSIQAVDHIFELACGLDSQVIGETQILSQLKDAYRTTVVYNLSGAILNRIMRKAFAVARIVRSQTDIQKGHLSIASLASSVADKYFGVKDKNMLIIGSGEMARLSAKYFFDKGARIRYIASRRPHVCDFAQDYNAQAVQLDRLDTLFEFVDIVVSCVYTPKPIISNINANKKILLMDLSVPSSISTQLKQNPNVVLYNIDDLKNNVENNLSSKIESTKIARQIINEQLKAFIEENNSMDYSRVIDTLRQYADKIRKIELKKFQKKYKPDSEMLEGIDKLTRSILNKTLHEPTSKIRQFIKEPEGDMYVELIKRLFNVSADKKPVNCFFSANPDNENN